MDEDEEESDKSKSSLSNKDERKLSLKASSNERKLLTVQSLVHFNDIENIAGPSSRITAEITVSCNYSDDSMTVSKGILQNVVEKVVGPSKSTARCFSLQTLNTVLHTTSSAKSNHEVTITPPAAPPVVLYTAPPLQGAPPTYSAIMRIGPNEELSKRLFRKREIGIQPSPPFIAPVPPPTYNDSVGIISTQPTTTAQNFQIDTEDSVWGPQPISLICPQCNNFVITNIRVRQSNITHFSALALCLCGCWLCCLLPYCMKSCKSTYHECPVCFNVLGIYNPWQI